MGNKRKSLCSSRSFTTRNYKRAKSQIEFEKELINPKSIPILEVGDVIEFSSWGEGKVISKNDLEKVYMIHFETLNGERPIRYDWRGIKKILKEDDDEINIIVEKDSLNDTKKRAIDSAEFISNRNQAIEDNQVKRGTFLSGLKDILRLKK